MTDLDDFARHAERCRHLATVITDPRTLDALTTMVEAYERQEAAPIDPAIPLAAVEIAWRRAEVLRTLEIYVAGVLTITDRMEVPLVGIHLNEARLGLQDAQVVPVMVEVPLVPRPEILH